MVGWFATLLIGIVLNIVAYLIIPQPKAPQPAETKDMDGPTNSTGSPIIVVWGSPTIKGLNVLRATERKTVRRKVKEGGKK